MNKSNKFIEISLLTLLLCVVIFFPLYRGLDAPYTASADAEVVYISQALLFNADFKQTYFDHTGYLAILFLSFWLKFSRMAGFIQLDDMVGLANSLEPFGQSFAPLVFSTRIFTLLLAAIFVIIFVIGFYLITRQQKLALFAGLILATTQGIAVQTLGFRPELLSAMFFMLALICVLLFVREESFSYQVGLVFLVGLFSYAALLTKYQIVIGVLCLPVIALGWKQGIDKFTSPKNLRKATIMVSLAFILISWPFLYAAFNYLIFDIKLLHILIVGYLAFTIFFHQIIHIKSWKHTAVLILSGLSGISLAFSYNLLNFDSRNTIQIFYFFEYAQPYITGELGTNFLVSLLNNFGITLLSKFSFGGDFFQYSHTLIYFGALLLIIVLAWRRRFRYSFQASSLLVLALILETVFRLRYLSSAYYIYYDFLLLMSIFMALIWLQEEIRFSKRNIYLINIGFVLLTILFFLQSKTAIDQNRFPAVNIYQSQESFCGMGYFTPAIGELIDYQDPEACVQILIEGCSPQAEISSCR